MITNPEQDRRFRRILLWCCIAFGIALGYLQCRGTIPDIWAP